MKNLDLNLVNFIVKEMEKILNDSTRTPNEKLKAIYVIKALSERLLV